MEVEAIFQFIRRARLAVVSTVHANGTPEAALVGIAVTPKNHIVFDTPSTTRKVHNLAVRPAAALVVGWDDEQSVQIEGIARAPEGEDLAEAKQAYFAGWPDGKTRESWAAITYIAVRPGWLRCASYSGIQTVIEFTL